VAFRYIAAGTHPDHDTLATFRRRFIDTLSDLFLQVLEMAREMKLLKLGTVCLDGTKIHANASRHSALSHGHIDRLEHHLQSQVQELLALAEQADTANIPDGMSLPKELQLRQDRLAAMAAAKAKIAARAQERYAREKAEFDEKMSQRLTQEQKTGKKTRGRPPVAPQPGVQDSDQINLTDEESRIMPVSGGGFEQCYNAQAAVDAHTMLVVAATLAQAPNDKQQVQPILQVLQQQAQSLRGCKAHAFDCRGPPRSPCALARALYRACAADGGRHADAGDDASAGHTSGQGRLRCTQADCRASVWHHQVRDGVQAVLAARQALGCR